MSSDVRLPKPHLDMKLHSSSILELLILRSPSGLPHHFSEYNSLSSRLSVS